MEAAAIAWTFKLDPVAVLAERSSLNRHVRAACAKAAEPFVRASLWIGPEDNGEEVTSFA